MILILFRKCKYSLNHLAHSETQLCHFPCYRHSDSNYNFTEIILFSHKISQALLLLGNHPLTQLVLITDKPEKIRNIALLAYPHNRRLKRNIFRKRHVVFRKPHRHCVVHQTKHILKQLSFVRIVLPLKGISHFSIFHDYCQRNLQYRPDASPIYKLMPDRIPELSF